MTPELKTSEEWIKCSEFKGLLILNPDGWDRRPEVFEQTWYIEKISKQEFLNRVSESTVQWSLGKL